jgi:regulator of protease activity HflC (stomatin/prohibitin superfamily)
MLSGLLVPVILLAVIAMMIFKVIPEYERAVVLRLGRALPQPKGPGLIILIPFVDKMIKISVRTVTMDIDPQDVITRDNVSLKVNAVVYFRVVDPLKAFVNVENYLYATSQLAQTHLRSKLGEHSFDDVLRDREGINTKLQKTLDENTDSWGIKVVSVEIKHVDLPADMQRAMAKEAEAEREKRAKVIAAEGELQAAEKLKQAADELTKNPATLQLRYLQTLSNMSSEQTTTIVFPLPIEMFKSFMK